MTGCRAGGPGRVYYEGPFGDFFLSELSVMAGGKAVPLQAGDRDRSQSRRPSRPRSTATRRLAGRSAAAREARIRPSFSSPRPSNDARDLVIQLLFERYYAAGLGRFRISVTTDPRPIAARDIPAEIEELLLIAGAAADPRPERAAPPALPDGRARAGQGAGGHRTAPQGDAGRSHDPGLARAPAR